MSAFAPTPTASSATATHVNPGVLASIRTARRNRSHSVLEPGRPVKFVKHPRRDGRRRQLTTPYADVSVGVKGFRHGSSVGPRDVVARHLHAMIVSAGRWETSRRCKAASVRLRLSRDR